MAKKQTEKQADNTSRADGGFLPSTVAGMVSVQALRTLIQGVDSALIIVFETGENGRGVATLIKAGNGEPATFPTE